MKSIIAALICVPASALACPGAASTAANTASAAEPVAAAAHQDATDPGSCAKKAGLVGSNCSYSTGMMAQRVLEEGKPWSYTGSLTAAANTLKSKVAAPFTAGPDQSIQVVANEVVEEIVTKGLAVSRVNLDGKLLEVDGVQYFVVTGYRNPTS